jgi:hypothetical protein
MVFRSEKTRTVLGLIMVILLVFITNQLDKKHFEETQEKLSSIYYDRVVAQDYLFDLSQIFHDRRVRLMNGEIISFKDDQEIGSLISLYEETNLTRKEDELFRRLKENIEELSKMGMTALGAAEGNTPRVILARIDGLLTDLSDIQLRESKSLKMQAQESLDSTNLMSNMEMILIIIIGIVLQFVLFSRRAETKEE